MDMRWMNPGKELEEYKKIFEGKKIFIFFFFSYGCEMADRLSACDCVAGFIDRSKAGDMIHGKMVYSVEEFCKLNSAKKYIVVIALRDKAEVIRVMNILLRLKLIEGVDFFEADLFNQFYISLYYLYAYNIVYSKIVSRIVTTKCTLNCRGCLNFTYANNYKRHFSMDEMVGDMDFYFSHIDYTYRISISGGEPLLSSSFVDIIEYIYSNYKERFHHFVIPTSCTVIPNEGIFSRLAGIPIEWQLDDYRENVDNRRIYINEYIGLIEKYKMQYTLNKVTEWINIDNTKNPLEDITEIENHYLKCCFPFAIVRDKRFYNCQYSIFAYEAGVCDDVINAGYIPNKKEALHKEKMVEFLLGFSEFGYTAFCKSCNGFWNDNTADRIKSAEQIDFGKR